MPRYFSLAEFACSETGDNKIKPSFVAEMDDLRDACGFPFVITSGYRSPLHSVEAAKAKPGTHSEGIAADVAVNGGHQRHLIVKYAMALGFEGIGVAKTFVHVDKRTTTPVVWSY